MSVCTRCGALVASTVTHDAWHLTLDTLTNGDPDVGNL